MRRPVEPVSVTHDTHLSESESYYVYIYLGDWENTLGCIRDRSAHPPGTRAAPPLAAGQAARQARARKPNTRQQPCTAAVTVYICTYVSLTRSVALSSAFPPTVALPIAVLPSTIAHSPRASGRILHNMHIDRIHDCTHQEPINNDRKEPAHHQPCIIVSAQFGPRLPWHPVARRIRSRAPSLMAGLTTHKKQQPHSAAILSSRPQRKLKLAPHQQKSPSGPSGCDGMRAKEIWPPRS